MAEFNISNSKVEQLNDTGSNVKITGASGSVAVSQEGSVVQATGDASPIRFGEKQNFWTTLWKKVTAFWSRIVG